MPGSTNVQAGNGEQQAVIVKIRLSDQGSGTEAEREKIFKLSDELIEAIGRSGSGEFDGNEIGGGFFVLYMYGASAAHLWDAIAPALLRFAAPADSYAIKRYGKPGAAQDRVALSGSTA